MNEADRMFEARERSGEEVDGYGAATGQEQPGWKWKKRRV
jgi:hypothetical protein